MQNLVHTLTLRILMVACGLTTTKAGSPLQASRTALASYHNEIHTTGLAGYNHTKSQIRISNEFEPAINTIMLHLLQDVFHKNDFNASVLEEYEANEKFFLTNDPNATTYVSFYGTVYSLLWLLSMAIVASMIICYWVGCEYESTMVQSYHRSLNMLAKCVPLNTHPDVHKHRMIS